ncbi:MAG: hypothetical protein ACRCSG_05170 [Cellulosilyticaceae bacterium]
MIFDNLIYPNNKNKEKKIKELEIELAKIFRNYQKAWNELCDQISPDEVVPKLRKSINQNSLEECLEEIDNATKELDNIVKNASEQLQSEQLIGKIDYGLEKMRTDTLRKIIKYSPIVTGGVTGIGIACLVCKKIIDKNKYIVTKMVSDWGIKLNVEQMLKMFKNEVMGATYFNGNLDALEQVPDKFLVKTEIENVYLNTYARVDKLRMQLCDKFGLIEDEAIKNKLINEVNKITCNSYREVYKGIYVSEEQLRNDIIANINYKDVGSDVIEKVIQRQRDINNLYIGSKNMFEDKIGSSMIEDQKMIKGIEARVKMNKANMDKVVNWNDEVDFADIKIDDKSLCTRKTKEVKPYFKTAVVGILIVVAVVLIMDAITCCIEGLCRSKELNKRLGEMNNIVGELTKTMGSQTTQLTKLTQGLKDGVIWLDKERMVIVNDSTAEARVIDASDIE